MNCPKCGGTAQNISPVKVKSGATAVFGCPACGHAFNPDGSDLVENPDQLQDIFRGATMAKGPLLEAFGKESTNPSQRAYLQARLLEYGLQMWMDGLKQGVLLGAIKNQKESDNGNG